jgi:hypothetical protein
MNPQELEKLMAGKWCDLQLLVLNYATEEERRARLDELDSVNYRGATLRGERRFFDLKTKSLNDKGLGIPVILSSWEMKLSPIN